MGTSEPAEDLESGWVGVPGVDGRADKIEFDTLDFLDELTHPLRLRIMRHLKDPNTIADLAQALDVPVTRLYHHINRLEEAGLIRVVATRKVGAATERRYQVVARSMGVAPKFFESLDPAEVATALGSIFDMAKLALQQQVEAGTVTFADDDDEPVVLSFGRLTLTPVRVAELHRRLTELLDEFSSDGSAHDPDAVKFALFVAAHPESD